MGRKRTTDEMLALYLDGKTPRQIGEIYEVSASAVAERLKKMGYDRPFRRLRTIAAAIDKSRLEQLYLVERLPPGEIAAAFGVSVKMIPKALAFYKIPKRPHPAAGGSYLGVLRKLRMGESAEIKFCRARDENQAAVLQESARRLGIIIAMTVPAGDDEETIRITRISENEDRRLAKIIAIDRTRLEQLYVGRKLSLFECARAFGGDGELIRQALEFYRIPRRVTNYSHGKYAPVFRELAVGETREVECAAKYPHTNLHTIATRVGVKISLRKIGTGKYRITKLK